MERIAERIRKLLALANNNPSETEAAIALERASALMAQHNLTMAQVDARGSGEERIEEKHNAAYRGQTWARTIWGAVSELNFCMWYYRSSTRGERLEATDDGGSIRIAREVDEHTIIGTRANVEATKAMVEYLIGTIERLARESKFHSERDLHAFKIGCADRVEVRLRLLRDKRAKAKKPSVPSTLPVLAEVYAAHDAANKEAYARIHGRAPRFAAGSYIGSSKAGAYERGQAAGSKVGLNTQVGRGSQRLLPKK
jgi:Protein of unknown function (DUF2786)